MPQATATTHPRRSHAERWRLLWLALAVLPSIAPLHAQDAHYSMLDLDPMLFNPAYAGFFDGTARFGAIYRNQWASVSTPFQTLSATAELALMRHRRRPGGLNAGLWLTADRAGTLSYGSTAAAAVVSYYAAIDRAANHMISVAVEGGVGQSGFSTDDIQLADGAEDFRRTRALYPTLGAGAAWFWQATDQFYTKLAVTLRNINQPDISYTGISDVRLSRRLGLYSRSEYRFGGNWGLLPVVGFQHQQRYSELLYGCDARWYVRETQPDYLAVSAGLLGRHGDAAAVNVAVMWRAWTFALSYDANLSRLASASHTLGAFEVGVLYTLVKPDRRKGSRSAMPCPVF